MLYTPLHRVKNAIRFKNAAENNLWMILGKTDPWSGGGYNDTNPPPDDPEAISVIDPAIAVKAEVFWIVEDEEGDLEFRDPSEDPPVLRKFYEDDNEEDMIDNLYSLIMVRGELLGSSLINLGESSFRQIGFSTNLVPATGHEADLILAPADVEEWGTLETIANRVPVSLIATTLYRDSQLIQF